MIQFLKDMALIGAGLTLFFTTLAIIFYDAPQDLEL